MSNKFFFENIWQNMTSDNVGFYTYKRKKSIPEKPGVYAWFLPLRFNSDINSFLSQARKLFIYDTKSKGKAIETDRLGFQWDPMTVSIQKQPDIRNQEFKSTRWKNLLEGDEESLQSFKNTLACGSIFARPLYVGLAKNLNGRYEQHLNKSGFKERFGSYASEIGVDISMERLLFSCISLNDVEEFTSLDQDRIDLLEDILKIICQPIFGKL